MKRLLQTLTAVAAFAAATWLAGWSAVVILALGLPFLLPGLSPTGIGVAAAVAWLGLILGADRDGSLGRLLTRLGGMMGVPGWMILAMAAGFAFLLAWAAARVVGLARPRA